MIHFFNVFLAACRLSLNEGIIIMVNHTPSFYSREGVVLRNRNLHKVSKKLTNFSGRLEKKERQRFEKNLETEMIGSRRQRHLVFERRLGSTAVDSGAQEASADSSGAMGMLSEEIGASISPSREEVGDNER